MSANGGIDDGADGAQRDATAGPSTDEELAERPVNGQPPPAPESDELHEALIDERERLLARREDMETAFERIEADFESAKKRIEARLRHVDALLGLQAADSANAEATSLLARRLRQAG